LELEIRERNEANLGEGGHGVNEEKK